MSKKRIMAAAVAGNEDEFNVIPLRRWIVNEEKNTESFDSIQNSKWSSKESIIRKTTIAYGILEIVLRCSETLQESYNSNTGDDIFSIDNFSIHVSKKSPQQQPWDDIKGVTMLSPKLSLAIEEPAYLACLYEPEEKQKQFGRHLEVERIIVEDTGAVRAVEDDNDEEVKSEENISFRTFYMVARVLYELFANEKITTENPNDQSKTAEPAHKKTKSSHQYPHYDHDSKRGVDRANMPFQISSVSRMQQLGIPASLCTIVHNLLEAASIDDHEHLCPTNDAYKSMKEVAKDLHLLLLDPDRFLFDNNAQDETQIRLRYRKDKLYGRDKEETLITEAFCRVSRGKSEAFFIGGFSGCGKSMLVDTLRARVNVVGGYVIKHKFDALCQGRSLSGVISAVNQLCLMIQARSTPQQLATLADKVNGEFGADVAFLARILQNIGSISPEFINPVSTKDVVADKMNARSVGFTLLRFLRLVSSRVHPIMLFLDDLQWADETALDVIHTFLSDRMGSCMFFVGTYRDNEVDTKHPIFNLMKRLEYSLVPTSKVALAGLHQEDLNTMISDALCLYPRICRSLSNAVLQKTGGNPFFVLQFVESLRDRGLLHFNTYQKRWVWDDDTVSAEDITDNVMHLLSRKMSGLPESIQLVLKVMACIGTSTKDSVIGHLSKTPHFSGVRDGLLRLVDDGFIEKNKEGEFKFVHDKIREAAYSLIPEGDKAQFHYTLGETLHSVTHADEDADDTILLIASQIYHGKECIPKDDELCIPIVKLSMNAGSKAIDCCRHEAAYTYLAAASSLLPVDCWGKHYDLSLQLHFLMASAANSSCKYDTAENILQKILSQGRCISDKVPSYFLLFQIYKGQGKLVDAYNNCSSILTQLGETVPESVTFNAIKAMIAETLRMYDEVYGDDWLRKKIKDSNLQNIVKFYGAMASSALFCKRDAMVDYSICKMIQMCLENGACKYTPMAFLKLSNIINRDGSNAVLAHQIANHGMSLSKSFDLSPDQMAELNFEFAYSIGYLEWFHSCVRRLRGGIESSLSSGNTRIGFLCAGLSTIFSVISGEKELTSLLKEIDYYLHLLETYRNELAKVFLLISRDAVSTMIDKGEATSIKTNESVGAEDDDRPRKVLEMIYFHGTIQNYWIGYSERCFHFAQKCFDLFHKPGRLYRVVILFYHGQGCVPIFYLPGKYPFIG